MKVAAQYADLAKELFEALLSIEDGSTEAGDVEVAPLAALRSKGDGDASYKLNGEDPGGCRFLGLVV